MQRLSLIRSIIGYGFLSIQATNASCAALLDSPVDSESGMYVKRSLAETWSSAELPRPLIAATSPVTLTADDSSRSAPTRIRWLLSLDGGGVRGLMQLHILADLERRTGKSIPEMFDGISGTSIGGILACLLTMPNPDNPTQPLYSANSLLRIFQHRLGELFVSKWQSFGGLFRTRYKTTSIKNILNDLLQNNRFKDRLLPVVLVAHDLNINEERLIATTDDEDFLAKHVAMATGAAPTYFKPQRVIPINTHSSHRGYVLSDGGTCMNNPTLPGLALMHTHYGISPSEVHVLSLGTGTRSVTHMDDGLLRGGILKWGRSIADTCIAGQSSAANHLTRTYCAERYHRFNPSLAPENMRLDDVSESNQDALFAASRRMLVERGEEFERIITALRRI